MIDEVVICSKFSLRFLALVLAVLPTLPEHLSKLYGKEFECLLGDEKYARKEAAAN